jgi:hypothetical protein
MAKTVTHTVTGAGAAPSVTGDQTYYGYVVSLKKSGNGYLMQFNPAWFLSGITANVAAAQDQHIACAPAKCEPVPNDHYYVDESKRTLTFSVGPDVHGYVLTPKEYFNGVQVGISDLAGIVAGTSPIKLFEPLDSGVWITVHIDTVTSFKQQYRP